MVLGLERTKKIYQAYKTVFDSPSGKMVLWDLMTRFGIMRSSFEGEKPLQLAFNEGRRATILFIQQVLKYNLSDFDKAEKEYGYHD